MSDTLTYEDLNILYEELRKYISSKDDLLNAVGFANSQQVKDWLPENRDIQSVLRIFLQSLLGRTTIEQQQNIFSCLVKEYPNSTVFGKHAKIPASQMSGFSSPPSGKSPQVYAGNKLIRHPNKVFDKIVERDSLYPQFLNFARERDIVFAVGGVGSGLDTFKRHFPEVMGGHGVCTVDSPDLDMDCYNSITKIREEAEKASNVQALVYLELKSLLTSLAYEAYRSLRETFPGEIDQGIGRSFDVVSHFTDYYFSNSTNGVMYKADPVAIIRYFFDTIQDLVEMTKATEVLVFMPWSNLAACFREQAPLEQKKLGDLLWKALDGMVAGNNNKGSSSPYKKSVPQPALPIYDKVCLVVCCTEPPFARASQGNKELVGRCIWPIPPLNASEIQILMKQMEAPEFETESVVANAAAEVLKWTGGVPWFVRLLMSYIAYNRHLLGEFEGNNSDLIAACARLVGDALEICDHEISDPVREFVLRHRQKVCCEFGNSSNDDTIIENAWACTLNEVKEGIKKTSRLGSFIATGLVWLKGDPWKHDKEDYVFVRYPTLHLQRATELPLAMYRSITGKAIRLPQF